MLLIISLIASSVCFDDIKADNRMPFSGVANEACHIFAADCNITDEDACTVEMISNTHTSVLNQHLAAHNGEKHRKSGTLHSCPDTGVYSVFSLNVFTSANTNIYADNLYVADVIHYIHEIDGKKRI